jgi:hypothetical protein
LRKSYASNPIVQKDTSKDINLIQIANTIKTCEQAEAIDDYILDKPNEANRVLLPLFIVYEYFDNAFGLTTSEISKVTIELGVKVSRQNCLRALKFTAKSYVLKDGNPPRYTLNRRGLAFIRSVLSGATEEDTKKVTKPKAKRHLSSKKSFVPKKGPSIMINELINAGFFTKKKSLSEIQKKLEEMGYIYAQTSLSGPVLKLVQDRKLKRNKEDDVWLYFAG